MHPTVHTCAHFNTLYIQPYWVGGGINKCAKSVDTCGMWVAEMMDGMALKVSIGKIANTLYCACLCMSLYSVHLTIQGQRSC